MAIYYPPPVEIIDAQGDPVLNAAGLPTYHAQPTIKRAAQATIDAQFKCARNYYDSYLNKRRAVFNILDDNNGNILARLKQRAYFIFWLPFRVT